MNLFRELRQLVYPQTCAGCGVWDTDLCGACWALAHAEPTLGALDDAQGVPWMPLWSLGAYNGPLRQVVLAAKHQPARNLRSFLFHAGTTLGQEVALNLDVENPRTLGSPIWVVPAPSSWRRQWDGHSVTDPLSAGVAAGLQAQMGRRHIPVRHAAQLRWSSGSQARKSGRQRTAARRGAFRLMEDPPPGTAVVLVDDVATTGATLAALSQLLGETVQAAAVLARA